VGGGVSCSVAVMHSGSSFDSDSLVAQPRPLPAQGPKSPMGRCDPVPRFKFHFWLAAQRPCCAVTRLRSCSAAARPSGSAATRMLLGEGRQRSDPDAAGGGPAAQRRHTRHRSPALRSSSDPASFAGQLRLARLLDKLDSLCGDSDPAWVARLGCGAQASTDAVFGAL
jgi:hypothetical protein